MRIEIIKAPYVGPSLNKIYAGIHWTKRKRHADDAHLAIKAVQKGVKPFTKPVSLDFQPMHKGRGYDVSNYAYSVKLLEDGLVQAGILGGDSVKFVTRIVIHQPIKIKTDSMMVITIVEDEQCEH